MSKEKEILTKIDWKQYDPEKLKITYKSNEEALKSIDWSQIDPPRVTNIADIKRDNIVLEKYLRIGDHVVMHMDKETRDYVTAVPDGTIGVVTSFYRFEDYAGRINNFGDTPGKYLRNGVAMVLWFDGTHSNPGAGNLRWLFDHEEKQKQRREDNAWNTAFEAKVRIADLPELPFYEGDIVKCISSSIRSSWDADQLIVKSINWNWYGQKRRDGSPMGIYDVTKIEPGWGSMTLDETEIELIERGKVWKWYNDKRDEIKFASLEEELAFHFSLGMDEQIRCEQSDNYHWPLTAILPALKAGIIDVVKHQSGFFGGAGSMAAFKMKDRDLGERARARCMEGFDRNIVPIQARVVGKEWNASVRKEVIARCIELEVPFYNVQHASGYVDTTELEKLNIQVVSINPADTQDKNFAKDSYVYFSPLQGAFDLHHTVTHEVREEELELGKALGRKPRGDRMRVRVLSNKGWSDKNRDIVIAACKNFGVIFADRKSLDYKTFEEANIGVLEVGDADDILIEFELNGYVFFTHRGMKDLPFDITVKGE